MFSPRSKVSQFSIVSVVGQPHLWTNKKDLAVVDYYSAVVDYVFVNHRPLLVGVTLEVDGIGRKKECSHPNVA
jgi:hypothetical protein